MDLTGGAHDHVLRALDDLPVHAQQVGLFERLETLVIRKTIRIERFKLTSC